MQRIRSSLISPASPSGTRRRPANTSLPGLPGAKVVKAFNTIGAAHMADPRFGTQRASMFLCDDDTGVKAMVAGLAGDLGFDPVDCGPLTQARLLEPLAMLWLSMAYALRGRPEYRFCPAAEIGGGSAVGFRPLGNWTGRLRMN
jgi:hypothetical protein